MTDATIFRAVLDIEQTRFGPPMTMCSIYRDDQKVCQIGASCELQDDGETATVGAFLHTSVADGESAYLSIEDVERLAEALTALGGELRECEQEIKEHCQRLSAQMKQERDEE